MGAKRKSAETQGCILSVDDEEAAREAIADLLDACGFTVLSADGFDAAVKELGKGVEIEAILCDLKMPGKSGLDVLRYVNEHHANIPLVFLTGFGTLESCQEAVKEGAFDYILKPIDNKDKVVFPLQYAIKQYRLEKQNREMKQDIIHMVEEHQTILEALLSDIDMREQVQGKIEKILKKWGDD